MDVWDYLNARYKASFTSNSDFGWLEHRKARWRMAGDDGLKPSMTSAATTDDGANLRKMRRSSLGVTSSTPSHRRVDVRHGLPSFTTKQLYTWKFIHFVVQVVSRVFRFTVIF